ncbi:MAG: DPP IV N-terminal domain-containing protein [Muribaculaceae bacterium]|nr:DPP IV N-terminal domain-containing protein [Muribaculaceae bacterium]
MKRIFKNVMLTLGGLATVQSASALSIEQYCDPAVCNPEAVKEMRPLADGVSYACISDDEQAIEVYSYKTGKMTSKLFDLREIKGKVKIDDFDGYELSDDNSKILLWTDKEKIYRHSFYAQYYVYDVRRGTLQKVTEGGPQRGAVLSHDGRMVAYQRDNNIFISNLDYNTDIAVTKDGERNKIIYGTSDWGYEEEFGVVNTMRWSKDDSVLAFVRFDETKVPAYNFDVYKSYCEDEPENDLYPEADSYEYRLGGCRTS